MVNNSDSKKDLSTDRIILIAARKVFLEKGFEGARMQHIADEAGINKALLHYYYGNKEKLFDGIFNEAFSSFFPKLNSYISEKITLKEKLFHFVDQYITLIQNNPHIPIFVLNELQRNPDRIVQMFQSRIKPEFFLLQIKNEMRAGNIRRFDPRQLITSIIGMCLFPFIAGPAIRGFMFSYNDKEFDKFLSDRRKFVKDFVWSAIRPEQLQSSMKKKNIRRKLP